MAISFLGSVHRIYATHDEIAHVARYERHIFGTPFFATSKVIRPKQRWKNELLLGNVWCGAVRAHLKRLWLHSAQISRLVGQQTLPYIQELLYVYAYAFSILPFPWHLHIHLVGEGDLPTRVYSPCIDVESKGLLMRLCWFNQFTVRFVVLFVWHFAMLNSTLVQAPQHNQLHRTPSARSFAADRTIG